VGYGCGTGAGGTKFYMEGSVMSDKAYWGLIIGTIILMACFGYFICR
jgi:hypothetical protein